MSRRLRFRPLTQCGDHAVVSRVAVRIAFRLGAPGLMATTACTGTSERGSYQLCLAPSSYTITWEGSESAMNSQFAS